MDARTEQPKSDRAWPLSKQLWVMRMTWSDLLFAHWSVEPDAVASLLPAGVTLDTRDGKAWVGLCRHCLYSANRRGRIYRGEIDQPLGRSPRPPTPNEPTPWVSLLVLRFRANPICCLPNPSTYVRGL